MPVGPFTRIAGNKAAGQITIAAFKGLALAGLFGVAFKISFMDLDHQRIENHYQALSNKK